MKIAIIGTGKMGSGLAQAFAKHHQVIIGSRDADKATRLAKDIGAAAGAGYAEAANDAEVIVLGVPWKAVPETLLELGDLSGKILLDITNPYGPGGLMEVEPSSSEEVQRQAPGARVVKGWNTVHFSYLAGPEIQGQAMSVFICGDDQEAKDTVAGLARGIGFDPVDAGPLSSAGALTRLLQLMVDLGWVPDSALKVLQR